MLIRSQDKRELLNMDALSELTFTIDYADNKPFQWNITAVRAVNGASEIGSYSSEDKALAVLDDIEASAINYDHAKASGDNLFSYLMPADGDPWFDRRDDNEQAD